LNLDLSLASASFSRTLLGRLEAIEGVADADAWQDLLELLQIGSRLGLALPERTLQDRLFVLLRTRLPGWVSGLADIRDSRYAAASAILAVAARLNLRTDEMRAALKPLEDRVASDPTFWP
jgi:hypothetical protein